MQQHKVCVVGAGYWGKNHIRTLHELGSLGGVVDSNDIVLDDIESDSIHVVSDGFEPVACSDSDIDYSYGDFVMWRSGEMQTPECDAGSIKVCSRDYYYSYEENGCVSLEGVVPSGYFTSNVHDNFISYEISNIPDQFLNIEFTNFFS